jgi:hypothetical protein
MLPLYPSAVRASLAYLEGECQPLDLSTCYRSALKAMWCMRSVCNQAPLVSPSLPAQRGISHSLPPSPIPVLHGWGASVFVGLPHPYGAAAQHVLSGSLLHPDFRVSCDRQVGHVAVILGPAPLTVTALTKLYRHRSGTCLRTMTYLAGVFVMASVFDLRPPARYRVIIHVVLSSALVGYSLSGVLPLISLLPSSLGLSLGLAPLAMSMC